MNAKTREVFRAVRRVYRLTRKGSYLVSHGLGPSTAAATALRAVTGKWNLCDPPPWNAWGDWVRTARGAYIRRPHVEALPPQGRKRPAVLPRGVARLGNGSA